MMAPETWAMPAVITTISSDRVSRARNGRMVRGASAWPMRMLAATLTLSAPLTFRNRLMVRALAPISRCITPRW
jgi:hypothetical protein